MPRLLRLVLLILVVPTMLVYALPASAEHGNADNASPNMFHLAQRPQPGVNSDLAFWQGGPVKGPYQDLAFAGNYNGFRILDIRHPENPKQISFFPCRGPQNDVSVYQADNRLLLITSVDTPQTTARCEGSADTTALNPTHFEGLRIFDVTDPTAPKQISSVYTDCGSHTHTTIPDKKNQRAIIYVSSYPLSPTGIGPRCQPPHAKISIVEIPDKAPEAAHVLKEQPLHADTVPFGAAVGCHDITAFYDTAPGSKGGIQMAAAACLSEGQLWDISDPANPTTQTTHTHIRNPLISIWHSSTFTWDGKVVVFGDEWGGGSAHGCDGPADPRGNLWFYDNVPPGTPAAPPLGRFMIPRAQPATDTCTGHNFNVIPVEDNEGYFLVSSWYQGGTSVVDFTNPSTPVEIGYYDAQVGGRADTWSTYWYNDFIYANDIRRGFDVFKLLENVDTGRQFRARKFHHMNPQTQEAFQTLGR